MMNINELKERAVLLDTLKLASDKNKLSAIKQQIRDFISDNRDEINSMCVNMWEAYDAFPEEFRYVVSHNKLVGYIDISEQKMRVDPYGYVHVKRDRIVWSCTKEEQLTTEDDIVSEIHSVTRTYNHLVKFVETGYDTVCKDFTKYVNDKLDRKEEAIRNA